MYLNVRTSPFSIRGTASISSCVTLLESSSEQTQPKKRNNMCSNIWKINMKNVIFMQKLNLWCLNVCDLILWLLRIWRSLKIEIWHLNTSSQRCQGDNKWCDKKYHAANTKYAVSLSLRTSNDFICALVKITSVQSCAAISWNKDIL